MSKNVANSDWRTVLQNLEALFSNNEVKLEILRKIDRSYFDNNHDLFEVFSEVCSEITRIEGVCSVCACIEVDGRLVKTVGTSDELKMKVDKLGSGLLTLSSGQLTDLSVDYKIVNSFGLRIPHIYKSNLIFVFEIDLSLIDQEEFAAFVNRNLFEQIKVLSSAFADREIRMAENSAYQAFFNNRLRPSASWKQLLSVVTSYLPAWSMPDAPDALLQQLLVYNEEDEFLKIAAGRNDETGQFILADHSICGRLIKNRSINFLLLDPSREDDYLGYGDAKSRTELAIRLDFEGNAVGVLNLEHPNVEAFSTAFQEGAKRACTFLAPIVGAMSARYESNKNKERALLYVFTDMLSRMGDTYGHLVSQPLFTSRNATSEIKYLLQQDEINRDELIIELGKLERAIDEFQTHSDDFTKGLPEFVSYGSQSVKSVISRRLAKFARLAKGEGIELTIEEQEQGLNAFASSLLQEHIFNIVNNSFQQVRMRIFTAAQKTGNISVHISERKGASSLDDATGLDYITVTIEDDGGGADEEVLKQIGQFGFTTKQEHGTGYGVAAAREYFESIGGGMKFGNNNNGFQTIITLQKFDSNIHTESSMAGLD